MYCHAWLHVRHVPTVSDRRSYGGLPEAFSWTVLCGETDESGMSVMCTENGSVLVTSN